MFAGDAPERCNGAQALNATKRRDYTATIAPMKWRKMQLVISSLKLLFICFTITSVIGHQFQERKRKKERGGGGGGKWDDQSVALYLSFIFFLYHHLFHFLFFRVCFMWLFYGALDGAYKSYQLHGSISNFHSSPSGDLCRYKQKKNE